MNSIFEIFKIGIGPSSSHTVAPMKAAKLFIDKISENDLKNIESIDICLFGSLAHTGKGHNIDKGLILGLFGYKPETVENNDIEEAYNSVISNKSLNLSFKKKIRFSVEKNIIYNIDEKLIENSNKMQFNAYDKNSNIISTGKYVSIGGGFVKDLDLNHDSSNQSSDFLYTFKTCSDLISICDKNDLLIHELTLKNEQNFKTEKQIKLDIIKIWNVMNDSIENGINSKGYLRGGLKLKRRAYDINKKLSRCENKDNLKFMDWVNLYAIAVNEENAAGGKVVTAPTNGAAGIIPAVIKYFLNFTESPSQDGIIKFFLTSATIGILYKMNASISGAEVGCQGEVGVACSMAAAGLVGALGGSNKEVENAAEIAMEHNLGLTCDPVKGLVQIPCIERNAMGAIKAINAARIAMLGKGKHKVSLDEVMKTMMQTGKDMQNIYKETSKGGLAVNVTEC